MDRNARSRRRNGSDGASRFYPDRTLSGDRYRRGAGGNAPARFVGRQGARELDKVSKQPATTGSRIADVCQRLRCVSHRRRCIRELSVMGELREPCRRRAEFHEAGPPGEPKGMDSQSSSLRSLPPRRQLADALPDYAGEKASLTWRAGRFLDRGSMNRCDNPLALSLALPGGGAARGC